MQSSSSDSSSSSGKTSVKWSDLCHSYEATKDGHQKDVLHPSCIFSESDICHVFSESDKMQIDKPFKLIDNLFLSGSSSKHSCTLSFHLVLITFVCFQNSANLLLGIGVCSMWLSGKEGVNESSLDMWGGAGSSMWCADHGLISGVPQTRSNGIMVRLSKNCMKIKICI